MLSSSSCQKQVVESTSVHWLQNNSWSSLWPAPARPDKHFKSEFGQGPNENIPSLLLFAHVNTKNIPPSITTVWVIRPISTGLRKLAGQPDLHWALCVSLWTELTKSRAQRRGEGQSLAWSFGVIISSLRYTSNYL